MKKSHAIALLALQPIVQHTAKSDPENLTQETLNLLKTPKTNSPQDFGILEARLITSFWAGAANVPFHILWLAKGLHQQEDLDLQQFLALLGKRRPLPQISKALTLANARLLALEAQRSSAAAVPIIIPAALLHCEVEIDGINTKLQTEPLRTVVGRYLFVRTVCLNKIHAFVTLVPAGAAQFFLPSNESGNPALP